MDFPAFRSSSVSKDGWSVYQWAATLWRAWHRQDLLAKAMAGEAGIAFISIEGSGFRAMFMGVDVLKMVSFIRRARKLAREYGSCIAYIDEIDAVGMSRGNVMGQGAMMPGMGMGGMMGTGALTRLLYEMD